MRPFDRGAQDWLRVSVPGTGGVDPERYDEGYDGPPAVTRKPDPFKAAPPAPDERQAG